jgi:hypothetical protein
MYRGVALLHVQIVVADSQPKDGGLWTTRDALPNIVCRGAAMHTIIITIIIIIIINTLLRGMASWAEKPQSSMNTGTMMPPPPVPVGADRAVLKNTMMSSSTSMPPKSSHSVL